jgi:hypothetical protein
MSRDRRRTAAQTGGRGLTHAARNRGLNACSRPHAAPWTRDRSHIGRALAPLRLSRKKLQKQAEEARAGNKTEAEGTRAPAAAEQRDVSARHPSRRQQCSSRAQTSCSGNREQVLLLAAALCYSASRSMACSGGGLPHPALRPVMK